MKKQAKASVFWYILRGELRKKVAKYLTTEEIQSLKSEVEEYQKKPREERRLWEQELYHFLTNQRSHLPAYLSLGAVLISGALFLLHLVFFPKMPDGLRIGVFQALFMGAVGPLALYLLPAWKARYLFVLRLKWEFWTSAFLVYLCLIWLLTEINQMMPQSGFSYRPDPFSLTLLTLGALSAPLLEEIVFRELLPSLFGKEPFAFGHMIAASLFAASHLPGSLQMFFYYLIAGGLLAILRIQSGRLSYGLLAHSLANAVVAVL